MAKKARKSSKTYEYTCKLALQEQLFPFHEQEPPCIAVTGLLFQHKFPKYLSYAYPNVQDIHTCVLEKQSHKKTQIKKLTLFVT